MECTTPYFDAMVAAMDAAFDINIIRATELAESIVDIFCDSPSIDVAVAVVPEGFREGLRYWIERALDWWQSLPMSKLTALSLIFTGPALWVWMSYATFIEYTSDNKKKHIVRELAGMAWWSTDTLPEQLQSGSRQMKYHHWHYSAYAHSTQMKIHHVVGAQEGSSEVSVIPEEFMHVVRALRVFGFFDKMSLMNFWKNSEIINVNAEEYLFTKEDTKDALYIVFKGEVEVSFKDSENDEPTIIKTVREGDQIYSLVAFLEIVSSQVLSGDVTKMNHKTGLVAKATENAQAIRIPMALFKEYWEDRQLLMVRSVKRILRRLHQVIFLSFQNMLGLTRELNADEYKYSLYENFSGEIGSVPPSLKEYAISKLAKYLNLKDHMSTIDAQCDVKLVGDMDVIWKPEDKPKHLIYLVKGELATCQDLLYDSAEELNADAHDSCFFIRPGQLIGGLLMLSGGPSGQYVMAPLKALIVLIPAKFFNDLMNQHAHLCLLLSTASLCQLSPIARLLDFGLEWCHLESGKILFKEGDIPDAIYLLVAGRIRSFSTVNDTVEFTQDFGRNEWIGLMETIVKHPRRNSMLAVRDSELTKIPWSIFQMLRKAFPIVSMCLLSFVSQEIAKATGKNSNSDPGTQSRALRKEKTGFTIAVVPVSEKLPATIFGLELVGHYQSYGKTLLLLTTDVFNYFGAEALSKANQSNLATWLARQEENYGLVIYMADATPTSWTLKCVRQADLILILTSVETAAEVTSVEDMVVAHSPRAKKELVMLHAIKEFNLDVKPNRSCPSGTKRWLEKRPWLSFHHHIRLPIAAFNFPGIMPRDIIQEQYPLTSEIDPESDMSRLSRWLSGNMIGVVLGGGGAKGAAHIGMLKKMEELKIPVDMISGVSIGSFVSALYAIYQDVYTVEKQARVWFNIMSHVWRYTSDLTLPYVAIFEAEGFNSTLRDMFRGIQIEDLWIPYFSISSDITAKGFRVHKYGELWRYVRGSMNLVGLLPPLCDPIDGHYLMDGGYTNLVPANVMREFGAQYVFSIDVSRTNPVGACGQKYAGQTLSGFKVLATNVTKFFPDAPEAIMPSFLALNDILSWIQGYLYLEAIKKMDAYSIYTRPPIDNYTGGHFSKFEELLKIGYAHAQKIFMNCKRGDSVDEIWYQLNRLCSDSEAGCVDEAVLNS